MKAMCHMAMVRQGPAEPALGRLRRPGLWKGHHERVAVMLAEHVSGGLAESLLRPCFPLKGVCARCMLKAVRDPDTSVPVLGKDGLRVQGGPWRRKGRSEECGWGWEAGREGPICCSPVKGSPAVSHTWGKGVRRAPGRWASQ